MLSGNKGEWSEIYTFFKLLSEQVLYSGDENLNKISTLFYPIVKILRQEAVGDFEYLIDRDIVIVRGGEEELRIPCKTFHQKATQLYREIKANTGAFALPSIQNFMESIHCYSVKAKSSDKTDIKIVIHDLRTGLEPTLGFSIKSEVGAASTIFNTNKDKTNFLYRISGISADDARQVNSMIKSFLPKFQRLNELGANIEFAGIVGKILRNNLDYADGHLPAILGRMILLYYSTPLSKIKEITERVKQENPLNFDYSDNQDFYEHKVKRLLTECTLGLKGTTVWRGKYEATGGYLIVKENGDVICYHIYDRNQFENYLFNNTRFDTPSTTRHDFGNIFQENGEFFIKLN
ncbi:MAG TPA: HpaII family restriction endonuclease, partial [Pyrinomonadaceae bacterium]|nr:HpaII family restriction endonuclease [Pyrinomonadaceae bacterium]